MLSCRGGGKLSMPVYLAPNPPGYQRKKIAYTTYFKLSECEDVSIINIIQINSAVFFVTLFRMLSCRGGGGKLSRPVYLAPHPLWYHSKIILLSFLILNYLNVMMYQL